MIRRTQEQWLALFAEHDQSDLSATAFCQAHELCPKYFSLRRRQLVNQSLSESKQGSVFVRMPTPIADNKPQNQNITLRGKFGELHFASMVSPSWLAALLKALA